MSYKAKFKNKTKIGMKIKNYLLVAVVATLFVSCSGGGSGMPNFGDNEFPVVTVGTSSASLQTTYPATIKGIQDVQVRPKVTGFITKVCVQEGQAVSAGQLLFVIDNETYQAAVRQSQAAVNTAKAQLSTARMTYENNKKLFDKKIIGQYELSTAENTLATAEAQLAQATAALASAKETLSFCYVKSPSAGVVGSLPLKVGALVSPSSADPLTTISNISNVEVFFSMSESEILTLSKTAGSVQSAISTLPAVKLQLADGTVYNHPGKVVKMSGVIDAATGSVSLIAHFNNPQHLLKSGGSGKIIIPRQDNAALMIPQEAVSQVQDKMFVYVVSQEGGKTVVKYKEIMVNPQNDGKTYIVTSGLSAGDQIVTKGITKLTDGMEIKPISLSEYQKKLDKAAALAEKQATSKGFVEAMKSK